MVKAGTLTLPMTANTLRVAGIQTDPVPTSRKENTAVAQSDPTFRAVDFKARSYGVIVSASLELLADSPNAETIIEQSLIGAMALTMDQAALNGDGSTAGNLDNVLGLLNVAGLTAAPAASQNNYDDTLAMIGTIRGANHEPSVSIMQPQLATLFATLKTGIAGDQTSLVAPADVSALTRLQSTSMPAATTVMGDFTKGAIGLREMLTLEATRTGGTSFAMAQVEIRALMRFDYQPLYLSAFGKITGQAPATVPSP
jgi:HK97 family phage major capsid protein